MSFLLLASAGSLFVLFAANMLDSLTSGNIVIAAAYAWDESEAHSPRQGIGVVSTGMGVGTLVGPTLGGALLSLGASVPFLVAAGISLVSIAASVAFLPSDRQRRELSAGPAETVPPGKLLPKPGDLAAIQGVKGLLAILSIFYLAFGLFTSQLALVLNARFQWNGAPLGPAEIGFVLSAASVVSTLVQLTLIRPFGSVIGDRTSPQSPCWSSPRASSRSARVWYCSFGSGIFAVAAGAAFARPALLSALSLVVPAGAQGAAMGTSQALGSPIKVAARSPAGFSSRPTNIGSGAHR
jgi:MFS transporter, DHA1 family, tetracycline resistance protein